MTAPADLPDDELAALAAQARVRLPDAPPALLQQALALWPARAAPAAAAVQAPAPLLQRLAAVLGFDSLAAQPAMAMRSAAPSVRQLLFHAGAHDIDLRIARPQPPQAGGFVLSGQVLGPGEGGRVLLQSAGVDVASAVLDEFGDFQFGLLPPGRYQFSVQIGELLIELPELALDDQAGA
ncbi:carboxypeptidase-like regulatory domain-containing protein [Aquincola sp. J276]|uniref:carboxypeptidase-like regulatory domain-containing protein n=1 Tax=Aquincola sp. J276 TaxID=2898432 RepID=UPI00215083A8|nr:carboxypeptidase-like regulatory domain-containing protein [Aquincola sp. J276]MCR5864147.1 carboxypeptidase-like regulatory domain-containing protein [Aquincola sp. J276]